MKSRHILWTVNGLLLVAGVGAWFWPRAEMETLHRARAALRADRDEVERLREMRGQLVASLGPAGEVEQLQSDPGELARLKEELTRLKERAAKKMVSANGEKGTSADPAAPVGAGPVVTAGEWKKAGTASPAATLETLMWAAAGGDIEAMVGAIKLDYNCRLAANAALAEMPEALRATYGTPERLVALLTMPNVPLGAMQVIKVDVSTPANTQNLEMAVMRVRLKSVEGTWQEKGLVLFRNPANEEGWKFSVQAAAVQEYLAMLKTPLPTPALVPVPP